MTLPKPELAHSLQFEVKGDERGSLIALEAGAQVPFEIRRVYYIYATVPGVRRGFHAHRRLQQVVVCVSGSCSFLIDNGTSQQVVRLDRPDVGLYIGAMQWREMFDFSPDCVLMVLADAVYDESDYIRSHAEFLRVLDDSPQQ